jgi:hypothetical protein
MAEDTKKPIPKLIPERDKYCLEEEKMVAVFIPITGISPLLPFEDFTKCKGEGEGKDTITLTKHTGHTQHLPRAGVSGDRREISQGSKSQSGAGEKQELSGNPKSQQWACNADGE